MDEHTYDATSPSESPVPSVPLHDNDTPNEHSWSEFVAVKSKINVKPTPPFPSIMGYVGTTPREVAEDLLRSKPNGTYLTRWSPKIDSLVLSFVDATNPTSPFSHIAGLELDEQGKMTVVTTRGILVYPEVTEYLQAMQRSQVVTDPLAQEVIYSPYSNISQYMTFTTE